MVSDSLVTYPSCIVHQYTGRQRSDYTLLQEEHEKTRALEGYVRPIQFDCCKTRRLDVLSNRHWAKSMHAPTTAPERLSSPCPPLWSGATTIFLSHKITRPLKPLGKDRTRIQKPTRTHPKLICPVSRRSKHTKTGRMGNSAWASATPSSGESDWHDSVHERSEKET